MYEWQQLIQTVVNEMDDAHYAPGRSGVDIAGAGGTSALF